MGMQVAAPHYPVQHGCTSRQRTDMRVNGQPERWLVAARLSRMSKRDRERGDEIINGIQTQDRKSAEWARQEGHVIVHVTRDKNVSGAMPPWKRPELGPWLTDPVKLVQYDGIVAYEVQRLSREYFDLAWLRKWAEEHGKKLYVIKERLRWPNNRDSSHWGMAGERAYEDRQDMIEKVTRELDALRAAGKLVGKPPFGFTTAGEKYDRRLVPTDVGRKWVPVIFQKVIDGWSGKKIDAWLRSQGVSELADTWWYRQIGHMIRNPVYKGFRCAYEIVPPDEVEADKDGETRLMRWSPAILVGDVLRWRYDTSWRETPRRTYGRVIHRCEALVTPTVWKKANDALDGRVIKGNLPDPEQVAMLARCLWCPNCEDAKMYRIRSTNFRRVKGVGEQGKQDTRYQYYYCRGKGKLRPSCGMTVRVDLADAAVCQIMEASFDVIVTENQIVYGNEAQVESELERIRWEIKQLGSEDLDDEEYDARLAELRSERDLVAATEIVEDRVEMLPTEDTYLGIWNNLQPHERGLWLADEGFRVYASKTEVTVSLGDTVVTAAL